MQNKTLQMKRALRTALLVLLLSAVGMGKGYAQYVFENLYYSPNEDLTSATITGHVDGMEATGTLTIPSTITHTVYDENGIPHIYVLPVTEIGDNAFKWCEGLTGSLVIPNTVLQIGGFAFHYCGFDGTLILGNALQTIGYGAFWGCSGFKETLSIPNTVTYIGSHSFEGCNGFTGSLIIPNSVTIIDKEAFFGCSGFDGSLVIGHSVSSIGDYSFYYCNGFQGDLTIPNSVTWIGNHTFENCTGFTGELVLSTNLTYIGDCAFSNCSNFHGDLIIGDSVENIGARAFEECRGFDGHLILGTSLTTINACAFYYCDGFIGNLTIPDSVIEIGSQSFDMCSGFDKHLSLGCSVKTIAWGAFGGCCHLSGDLIIPNSVTELGEYVFSGCNGFNGRLVIPNSITRIGSATFLDCNNLSGTLIIPNSVTEIGSEAFKNCQSFTGSLSIPNSVTSIGWEAFNACDGFSGCLKLGNSIEHIGCRAFNCRGIQSIVSTNETPPFVEVNVAGDDGFGEIEKAIPIYVPCESLEAYINSNVWEDFTNYNPADFTYDLRLDTNEPDCGVVMITQQPACETRETIVQAISNQNYYFVAWEENGNEVSRDSVYRFTIDHDTYLVARLQRSNGLVSISSSSFVVYPNPTKSQITIEAEDLKHISISNMLGQQIYEGEARGNAFSYDFGKHGAGLYLVRIETANGMAVKKVSVTR